MLYGDLRHAMEQHGVTLPKAKKHLGEGGFGGVCLGTVDDHGAAHRVAVKCGLDPIPPEGHADRKVHDGEVSFLNRLHTDGPLRSSGSLLTLLKPPILLDDGGVRYLVSVWEYMEGRSLRDRLNDFPGGFDRQTVHEFLLPVAEGLDLLRREGFTHGDVRPANVLLAWGESKLADFGAAYDHAGSTRHTGAVVGTPAYLPEEARSQKADGRYVLSPTRDGYALGTMYAELRTGRSPFGGAIGELDRKANPDGADLDGLDPDERAFVRGLTHPDRDRRNDAPLRDQLERLGPRHRPVHPVTAPVPPPTVAVRGDGYSAVVDVRADGTGDHRTISAALAAVPDGALIRVHEGLYREGPVVDRPVTIEGVGEREFVVVEADDVHALRLKAETATVRGLTLRGRAGRNGRKFFGVDISAGRPEMENCLVTSDSLACIAVRGAETAPTLRDCTAEDGEQSGLFVYGGAGGSFTGCTFRGNKLSGVAVKGEGTAPTLRDCTAEDGEEAGLFVYDGAGGSFTGCTFRGNKFAGVAVMGEGTTPTLRDCTAEENLGGLHVYGGAGGSFAGCTFRGNKSCGVEVKGEGTAPTLRDCTAEGSKEGSGLHVYDGAGGSFAGCTFRGNKTCGVEVRDAGTAPTLRDCRIDANGYEGVWIAKAAAATVTGCDLTGNDRGPWDIEDGCEVVRSGNTE